MRLVLDTNVVVSAVLSANGRPAWLVSQVLSHRLDLCYDFRIAEEYREVLLRPKFRLEPAFVDAYLEGLLSGGVEVVPDPVNVEFSDAEDKKFYEVAKFCCAPLVTGNPKHFPEDPWVLGVGEFCDRFLA